MHPGLRLQFGQEIVWFCPKLEDGGNLAAPHLLDRQTMLEQNRLNLDAKSLEDHRPGDARTRSLDVKSHLLARQILQAVDAGARQDVELGVVHLRYVIDPLVDIPRLAGFLVEVENVSVGNRDVDSP